MSVRIVDDGNDDNSVELATVSDVIDWLFDWVTSLFVVGLDDEMAFVSRLELWSVDGWIVDDETASVTAVDVLGWLLVAYSDVDSSVITVECIEVLPAVIGWTDDVITVVLWSEIDDDAVLALAIVCVDDDDGTDELSVELEVLLIAVVGTPVSDDDVLISMEVACVSDVDDNDEYSLDANVFSLLVLEIPDDIVEINGLVDSSDSIDVVWSFWELNRVVNTDVSDEISSLFPVVADAVDNVLVCSAVESVWCNDATGSDVTTVEVKSTISSVVVGLRVFIVVPLVDIGKDEDREEYSVELIRFSIAVEMELDKSSVYSE